MAQGLAGKNVAFAGNGITQIFVNGVKQTLTGDNVDITGIPSGVKEFKITVVDLQTSSNTEFGHIQLGDAGGIETTGYSAGSSSIVSSVGSQNNVNGFLLYETSNNFKLNGVLHFVLHEESTNTWCMSGVTSRGVGYAGTVTTGGSKSLSGELTTIRLTPHLTTETWLGGSVNIQYDNPNPSVLANLNSGAIVQVVHDQDGEVASGTTNITFDDSIPQNTEGTEVLSASITPVKVGNRLKIDVVVQAAHSASGHVVGVALFQDSTADALAVSTFVTGGAAYFSAIPLTFFATAADVVSTTFKVRLGGHTSGSWTFNGQSGAAKYGGVYASTITITEIAS